MWSPAGSLISKVAYESLRKYKRFFAESIGVFRRMKPFEKESRVFAEYEGDNRQYYRTQHIKEIPTYQECYY